LASRTLVVFGVTTLAVAVGVVAGCGGDSSSTSTAGSAAPHVNVTLNAGNTALVRGKDGITHLVLTQYDSAVEETSVSPANDRVSVPTAIWARGWKAQYKNYEPNSVLVYRSGGRAQRMSIKLASGTYNPVKRRMDFVLRPLATGATSELPIASSGARAGVKVLGPSTLFVDPTADFGEDTQPEAQSAVSGYLTSFGATTVSSQVYTCCEAAYSPPEIVNSLTDGAAYSTLLVQPSWSGTITFSGSPAFGGMSVSGGGDIVFTNGSDTDGATFGLSGAGAFNVSNGSLAFREGTGNVGIQNLVIYGGNFEDATVGGTLGSNSALIEGNFYSSALKNFSTNDALLANLDLSGVTFSNTDGGATTFEDTALIGVSFAGSIFSNLAFKGSSLVPYNQANADGSNTVVSTSFKGINSASLSFGTGSTGANYLIDGVDFSGSQWDTLEMTSASITNTDFSNADLSGATKFSNTSFDNASTFEATNFGNTTFDQCSFNGTDFSTATFSKPTFTGSAQEPVAMTSVTFDSSFASSGATFNYTTFDGVTFVGLDSSSASDKAFVSSLMTSEGAATAGNGLIAFNNQYVSDGQGNWYQANAEGTEWQQIDTTTLESNGEPPVTVDPQPAEAP